MISAKDTHIVVGFLRFLSFGHLYVFSGATLESYKALWNISGKRAQIWWGKKLGSSGEKQQRQNKVTFAESFLKVFISVRFCSLSNDSFVKLIKKIQLFVFYLLSRNLDIWAKWKVVSAKLETRQQSWKEYWSWCMLHMHCAAVGGVEQAAEALCWQPVSGSCICVGQSLSLSMNLGI